MSRLAKRMAAMVLAAAMMVCAGTEAFAANPSGGSGNTKSDTTITTTKASSDEVNVTKASSTKDTLFVAGKQKGKKILSLASGVVSNKKYKTITFEVYRRTKWKKNILKKNAKKTKKVIITKAKDAKKLVAKKFNSKAFKGYTGKIIVKKGAMTKKEFNKLKKKLKKGGFKGKISRK